MNSSHTPINDTYVADLLTSRRTVHEFADEQPSAESLHALIQAGVDKARWAPNHGLTEPWDFYHLGEQTAQQVAQLNAELVRAKKGDAAADKKLQRWLSMPEWLVVTQTLPRASLQASHPEKYAYIEREDYAATACAIQNLMLYCHSQGLGSKWSTGEVTRSPELYHLLNIDSMQATIVGIIWIGMAKNPDKRSSIRKRNLNDIYHRLA